MYWETDGAAGAPLVMPGADLRQLDLREQILAGAQLQGADLRNSLLDSTVLIRAAFDGARMSGTSLFSADASKATFSDAQLMGAHGLRSTWRRALLARADLTGALLDDTDLRGAELVGARLDRASLVGADLRQAVLLEATFAAADLTDAHLDGAVAGPRTFAGAHGVSGTPIVGAHSTPRRRPANELEFESRVRDHLRERHIEILHGFDPGPDLVAILSDRWFAAIEVSTSSNKDRLFRLADRADLIVVPDDLEVRVAMNGTRVAHLAEADAAVRDLATSRLKPFGASAVLIREAARLRPYLLLARRARVDSSLLSRLSVYLDARDPVLLSASDRVFAETLPSHLDGAMAARSAQCAEQHYEELEELLTRAAQLLQGKRSDAEEVTHLARKALALEYQFAEHARSEAD
ncbi:MAG: pentapeptide repeat-containing protein [Solirubrobacterales bacterium]|nr:pentapeptide repeat-containing protein [Solirubrobacterales bacterium]